MKIKKLMIIINEGSPSELRGRALSTDPSVDCQQRKGRYSDVKAWYTTKYSDARVLARVIEREEGSVPAVQYRSD